MASKVVRVRDLRNQTGMFGPHSMLLCVSCGGEYSANAGDYFMARPDTVMRCCDEPMRLVTKRTQYLEVSNARK